MTPVDDRTAERKWPQLEPVAEGRQRRAGSVTAGEGNENKPT